MTDGTSVSILLSKPKDVYQPLVDDDDEPASASGSISTSTSAIPFTPVGNLENYHRFGLDPGRENVFVTVDRDERKVSLSLKEYYSRTGVSNRQKWEQGRLARSALGPFLSSLPSRNCSTLEGFRAYLSALRPSLPRILAFYGSPKWRNAAFRCYYLRQKLLHDVCHQFRKTGKQTVVFFGAARFNLSSRGHPSTTPLALIRRELSRFPGVTVIPIDEFRTSQICSKCMTRMGGPSPFGSWRLKACPHCRTVWDRDVNAARNILYLGDRMDANAGARPEPFCRG